MSFGKRLAIAVVSIVLPAWGALAQGAVVPMVENPTRGPAAAGGESGMRGNGSPTPSGHAASTGTGEGSGNAAATGGNAGGNPSKN